MAACTRGTMFPSTLNNRSSLAVSRCTQNPTLACTLAKKESGYKLMAQMPCHTGMLDCSHSPDLFMTMITVSKEDYLKAIAEAEAEGELSSLRLSHIGFRSHGPR
jgi:hypothetical protein